MTQEEKCRHAFITPPRAVVYSTTIDGKGGRVELTCVRYRCLVCETFQQEWIPSEDYVPV